MFYSDPYPNLPDPVWDKNNPEFNERILYPYAEILKTPEECVMALDWIILNIVDLYDDPIVEQTDEYRKWYDFVWGKTWSIRRQVVQMRLDDLEAVGIMERCARFHIFCAHAFADFPPGYFIPKINFEHIGKILVGLKVQYAELNERGIHCANEAEFMSYYLIHFPASYKDAGEFPPAVRSSEPIQIAFKFLTALNSDNYVAFFELLKEATYLQACLMHRYFVQMRTKAFYVMWKAFRARSELPAHVNKEKICTMLAFENEKECDDYLLSLGINFTESDIIFDKSSFEKSFPNPLIFRSSAIERLRQDRYLSDIINGGEGQMVSPDLDSVFSPPKLDKLSKTIEKLHLRVRISEGIWKGIMMSVISNKLSEILNNLMHPFGEPDYGEISIPSDISIISLLDGTLNESDAEIIFDSRESEMNRIQEDKHFKSLLSESLQDNSDKEVMKLRSKCEQKPCDEEESAGNEQESENEQEPNDDDIQEPNDDDERETGDGDTQTPNDQEPNDDEKNDEDEPEEDNEDESEDDEDDDDDEEDDDGEIQPTINKVERMRLANEATKKPQLLLKFVRPRKGVGICFTKIEQEELKELDPRLSVRILESGSESSIGQASGSGIHKDLDDSDLIVSEDDVPKPSNPKKPVRATASSVIRAIARMNEKRKR